MSKDKGPLAKKFKELESDFSYILPNNKIVGYRLDGKSFHTFTKSFDRPFDHKLMKAMDEATLEVIQQVLPHAICGYTQSDEISVFVDERKLESDKKEQIFSGKIQKLVSVSASAATAGFLSSLIKQGIQPRKLPLFDSRVFVLDSLDEVFENITWRRLDARKNAVTMAAESLFSSKELHGKSTPERITMLEGTAYERLPEDFMNGRFFFRKDKEELVTIPSIKGKEGKTILVNKKSWVSAPAERKLVEDFFKELGVEVESR